MSEIQFIIQFRGNETYTKQILFPGRSLVGCVANFRVVPKLTGFATSLIPVLELVSGVDAGLVIESTLIVQSIGGTSVPIGSGVITLTIAPTQTTSISPGEYLHSLKLHLPAVGAVEANKESIMAGQLVRLPTINAA